MKRSELEKHIGESVEVKLFDGDTMQGVLRKTGTEEVRNNPNLYLKGGYYFLSHKDTYVCKSCLVHMKKCSLCGEKALEGIEICPECLKRAAVAPKQIKRLRQISNILSITADTDTNIKACMQSITEIADDLERGSYGEEEKKQESNTVPT